MRGSTSASLLTRLALLSLAQAGCLGSAREAQECLDRRESIAYVSQIRQSIAAEWRKPSGTRGRVSVVARVNREGELRNPTITVSLRADSECGESLRCRMVEEPLRRSMEAAVRNARAVGPPPEGARCMLERTLSLSFETSERYVPDSELELSPVESDLPPAP